MWAKASTLTIKRKSEVFGHPKLHGNGCPFMSPLQQSKSLKTFIIKSIPHGSTTFALLSCGNWTSLSLCLVNCIMGLFEFPATTTTTDLEEFLHYLQILDLPRSADIHMGNSQLNFGFSSVHVGGFEPVYIIIWQCLSHYF